MTAQFRAEQVSAGRQRRLSFTFDAFLAVLGFLVVMRTFRIFIEGGGSLSRTDGSPLFQILSGGIYLAAIGSLVARGIPSSAFKLLLRAWPLVLLTALTLISTIWSQAPEATFRRAAALILTSAFALFVVVRFDLRSILKLLTISFAIFCAGSVLVALIPGVGITPSGTYAGAWRGLSFQKNSFGCTIALGIALLAPAIALGQVKRGLKILALAAILLVLLLLSRSATALVTAFGSVAIGTLLYAALGGRIRRTRLRPELGIALLLISVPTVFILISQNWELILAALGRDSTLSGRVKLWEWAIGLNEARQFLGSGYRAFWIDANTLYFSESFYWDADADGNRLGSLGPNHSHSGYVDLYLEFGQVGAAIFVTLIASSLFRLRRVIAGGAFGLALLFSIMLCFVLIYASTERSILQQSEDLWLFFIILYLLTVKESLAQNEAFARPGAMLGVTPIGANPRIGPVLTRVKPRRVDPADDRLAGLGSASGYGARQFD